MRTLYVDLAEVADPHQTLWRIGYAILTGETSGTEHGCQWEIKEEQGEDNSNREACAASAARSLQNDFCGDCGEECEELSTVENRYGDTQRVCPTCADMYDD